MVPFGGVVLHNTLQEVSITLCIIIYLVVFIGEVRGVVKRLLLSLTTLSGVGGRSKLGMAEGS